MGIEYSSVVDAPPDEVFAWHGRPGAIRRLVPPWQPMRVIEEASSLAGGRAILGLPGGLRWPADHQPAAYDPPWRFVDELGRDGLASLPVGLVGRWRHDHEFESVDPGRTRVIDRVDTPIPGRLLRQTFRYRHRQLADDVDAHHRARSWAATPVTVAVTGASGLVGSALTAFLTTGGHRVVRLVRRPASGPDERYWDPMDPADHLLQGVDAVVHLAGASIAGRFTGGHRTAIRDSRITPTRLLAERAAVSGGPGVFVSASAIGLYGYDRCDELLDESSSRGAGFLADVVAGWEAATSPAQAGGLRVVQVRTGIVQSGRGGTVALLRPLFTAGIGGRLGDGRQWTSWIDIEDLVDVYHRAILDPELAGPVNAVSPEPVRNDEYTRTLARVLNRPALLPVPSPVPELLLGRQGARELAFADQRVQPRILLERGHAFRRPDLEDSLRHQLGHIRGSG
ncbi:TIGR01777 family protein [Gordonia desulfuricans]|uniref:TIGR01777 family protein n=1 Tax=Gordonia desulfuricans TaxID=89051 RepID=A0A7K3LRG6_9ACTN|nr:TIGR01777 family oxidoreductase [Gordonia desulfuricans]NDK90800.1 TIGR01777 family protein [Gordonia desulfuricans]